MLFFNCVSRSRHEQTHSIFAGDASFALECVHFAAIAHWRLPGSMAQVRTIDT